jgi:hypothetical protein
MKKFVAGVLIGAVAGYAFPAYVLWKNKSLGFMSGAMAASIRVMEIAGSHDARTALLYMTSLSKCAFNPNRDKWIHNAMDQFNPNSSNDTVLDTIAKCGGWAGF